MAKKDEVDAATAFIRTHPAAAPTLGYGLAKRDSLFIAYDPVSCAELSVGRYANDRAYEPLGRGKDDLITGYVSGNVWDTQPEYGELDLAGRKAFMLRGQFKSDSGAIDAELYSLVTKTYVYTFTFVYHGENEAAVRPINRGILSTLKVAE